MTLRFDLVLRPSPCEIARFRDAVRELTIVGGTREAAERAAAERVFLVRQTAPAA
ncbi:hypothetical protein [Aureimonas jatrophae]|uniref:Uncharacterized protein n=1 Tax=Aureimonas jatrophae TaxID=1166073 RepID=A0A1H0K1K4_9HYPH|nr:hypothetical protein [Aureimonas jatrophae]MBB3950907.1 hypothetical protein [Aureimonas jatrophae]SDO49847.1 hypothetical protein SAMN05192530_10753 [Aureimonas jatrophae]